jgi:uncharacterized membrane protein
LEVLITYILSVEIFSMIRQNSVVCTLSGISQCWTGIWLNSQAFAHLLRATGLMPRTAQINDNYLEYHVEGLVVYFWAAFTIEAFLLCALEAAGNLKELYSLWARKVVTCYTCTSVCVSRGASTQARGDLQMHQSVGSR